MIQAIRCSSILGLSAALLLSASCADRLTAPVPPLGDYVLMAGSDSAGHPLALPAALAIGVLGDSEFVYAGMFTLTGRSQWHLSWTVVYRFSGVMGPPVQEADSGHYQYAITRNPSGQAVGVLSLDPFNIEHEPAVISGDTLRHLNLIYVRHR